MTTTMDCYKAAHVAIRQRPGRMTQTQAREVGWGSTPIVNLVRDLPALGRALEDRTSAAHGHGQHPYFLTTSRAVVGLGPPMVRVTGLETTMGVWIFDDVLSGITFSVWSDGYKKKPWKGTSIEVRATPEEVPQVLGAFERLSEHLLERYLAHEVLPPVVSTKTAGRSRGPRP